MKIGISCYPTWGGSGVVATELAMALAAGGDEVHVISYARPTRLEFIHPRLSYHEVIVPHYPLFEYPPYSLALATQIVEVARHQNLDVIHVHYAIPNAVSAVLAREILAPQPLKVVTTLHGTDITLVGNDPNYLETTRFGIVRSDAVTAVSHSLRDATRETFGIENSIDVIPNFIEPHRFERVRNQPEVHQWSREGEKVLVHISNFRPVKRVMDVVEIFRRVYEQIPKSHLILVGDGPDRAKAEQFCRDSGICHAITFVGSLPAVEEVLAGADLFLLPSETESFGLAALEALSCEVPVIATKVGGLPEVVQHGVHGYLHPVGAVDEMATSAIGLLNNEEQQRQFGKAARRWAVEQFSEERIVAQYREIYQRVLA
jgi:N-acetyl-alpha-D-glucosaminyl L-malate synthase BshA